MVESPMERAAREREEDAAKARELAELRRGREEEKRGRFFNPFESVSAPQQCESSYDCEAPMVCCDLIVASVCCSGVQTPCSMRNTRKPALERTRSQRCSIGIHATVFVPLRSRAHPPSPLCSGPPPPIRPPPLCSA
mmetsp:Transcript_37600/g.117818  ORF Transcript_37600/g.117818 Transcript_37600/m.117818 type:complete len:137 (-) Transcript_37600:486-896(-)